MPSGSRMFGGKKSEIEGGWNSPSDDEVFAISVAA
jgi:hypothetical protein